MNAMYRQGDVLIIAIDTIPEGATEIPRGHRGVVLAEGEVTGHAHRIPSRSASLYRDESDARYLRVMGPAPRKVERVIINQDGDERVVTVLESVPGTTVDLLHEEHSAVSLPPGDYRIAIHVEYSPGELPRQVAD